MANGRVGGGAGGVGGGGYGGGLGGAGSGLGGGQQGMLANPNLLAAARQVRSSGDRPPLRLQVLTCVSSHNYASEQRSMTG